MFLEILIFIHKTRVVYLHLLSDSPLYVDVVCSTAKNLLLVRLILVFFFLTVDTDNFTVSSVSAELWVMPFYPFFNSNLYKSTKKENLLVIWNVVIDFDLRASIVFDVPCVTKNNKLIWTSCRYSFVLNKLLFFQ